MNLFGNFEALLHSRFPKLELVIRNFARPCDAVDNRQRPNSYTALDDPLKVFGADTFLCFFGFNEAFAGQAGEDQFREAYGKYLDEMAQKYPRAGGKANRFPNPMRRSRRSHAFWEQHWPRAIRMCLRDAESGW